MKKDSVYRIEEYSVSNFINSIEMGLIALPELQRPFVWSDYQVRDLIDSLYNGLPVGLIILWHIKDTEDFKPINSNRENLPDYLVIDGQQRLSALYSIFKGESLYNNNYKLHRPVISFNPISEEFECLNHDIENDPFWINDISQVFKNNIFSFIEEYMSNLSNLNLDFNKTLVQVNIASLYELGENLLNAVVLSEGLSIKKVARIFVRINSQGNNLSVEDYIFTLLSIFWNDGKVLIEDFIKGSHEPGEGVKSYNVIEAKPSKTDLLKSILGYSFYRGKLNYAYSSLNDIVLGTKLDRTNTIEKFRDGVETVCNPVFWHDYISLIDRIGFVSYKDLIQNSSTLFYTTYALYLLGRRKFDISIEDLKSVIRRWFVFCLLTKRHASSNPQKSSDDDLRLIENCDDFAGTLENIMYETLTDRFWYDELPLLLIAQKNCYANVVYLASTIYKNENVLFAHIKLKDYLKVNNSSKNQVDKHHIFPKNYLKGKNLKQYEYDQVANLIYIDYSTNIFIRDNPPRVYWPLVLDTRLNRVDREYVLNNYTSVYDLPEKFWEMDYDNFLIERRKLMANSIHEYFNQL